MNNSASASIEPDAVDAKCSMAMRSTPALASSERREKYGDGGSFVGEYGQAVDG